MVPDVEGPKRIAISASKTTLPNFFVSLTLGGTEAKHSVSMWKHSYFLAVSMGRALASDSSDVQPSINAKRQRSSPVFSRPSQGDKIRLSGFMLFFGLFLKVVFTLDALRCLAIS